MHTSDQIATAALICAISLSVKKIFTLFTPYALSAAYHPDSIFAIGLFLPAATRQYDSEKAVTLIILIIP